MLVFVISNASSQVSEDNMMDGCTTHACACTELKKLKNEDVPPDTTKQATTTTNHEPYTAYKQLETKEARDTVCNLTHSTKFRILQQTLQKNKK